MGTELLLGHTINSDAAYVARELAALGINVFHSQVVGDNPGRLEKASLRESLDRSDIALSQPADLAPTGDDLTKETIALVAESPLVEDAASAAKPCRIFWQPRNDGKPEKAMLFFRKDPRSFPIPPGHGSWLRRVLQGGKIIIMLLPGPPRELLPILENSVRPFSGKSGPFFALHRHYPCFRHGEGKVAQVLGPLLDGANPTAATYAGDGELFVRVSSRAENPEKSAANGLAAAERYL